MTEMQELPCGCKMGEEGGQFIFEPHSLECEYYLYVIEQAEARNKPITYEVVNDE